MSDFDRAFLIIVGAEGAYSNNPADPGGETMFGVTKKVAEAHGYLNDMRAMPIEFAKAVYQADYWKMSACDQYNWPLNLYVFDAAVNQGCEAAAKMLQRAIGITPDGVIGAVTISRARLVGPEQCALFMSERALRYAATSRFDTFGRGWMKRLFSIAQKGAAS